MKRVIWEDDEGALHCSLLRDNDDPKFPEIGLPIEPPPIERIISNAAMEVRNEFVKRGYVTYQDIVKSQTGIASVLNDVLKRKIVEAYKELNRNGN
jgi:hypothetical protein